MLNLDNLRRCRRFDRPFTFGLVEDPFRDLGDVGTLAEEFPPAGFESRSHAGGSYARRPLFKLGEDGPYQPEQLGPKTLELARLLASQAYRDALGETMSVDLSTARLEAWFWRYDAGTMFVPHRDLETKLVTQVFYLNAVWPARAGGRLRILNSEAPDDLSFEIAPDRRLSSIIRRSDTSWHLITPISPEAPASRDTITVHFHSP